MSNQQAPLYSITLVIRQQAAPKCPALRSYYSSCSCKKKKEGELVYKSLLSHLEHTMALHLPLLVQLCVLAENSYLEIPCTRMYNCLSLQEFGREAEHYAL